MKMSRAFAGWLDGPGTVMLGRDTRFGAQMLCHAISSGLESMGIDVVDCGVLPTPALGLSIRDAEALGGVMVTGSHMPPERIGLIYMDSDACYVCGEAALDIEKRYFESIVPEEPVSMDAIGTLTGDAGRITGYREFLMGLVDRDVVGKLSGRPGFRVLADPGNGTACGILPDLIEQYGIDTVRLHDEVKGDPDRPPEPRKHTLNGTASRLLKEKASLGIATDLDADRVLFIDESGEVISEDVIGAIFARWVFSKPGVKALDVPVCVTPVNSSGLIEYVAREHGVEVRYCRIGQPDTERRLREFGKRAVYAYEESGKYYFAVDVHWCDGILAALYLLEIMAESGRTLGELASGFPNFYQSKAQFGCPDDRKSDVYARVVELFNESPSLLEGMKRDLLIDGYKRIYDDDSWLLLRPSGTEPLFRLYSDAMSQERADLLLEKGMELARRAIDECCR